MKPPGALTALAGDDEQLTGTHLRLLSERLKSVGYRVASLEFPRYQQGSAHFAAAYHNRHYGPPQQVDPHVASLFFVLEYYDAAEELRLMLATNDVVLVSGYVIDVRQRQSLKLADRVARERFGGWLDHLAYQALGLPRPLLSFYLQSTAQKTPAVELMANEDSLQLIPATKNRQPIGLTAINSAIWEKLLPQLPPPTQPPRRRKLRLVQTKSYRDYLKPSASGRPALTSKGRQYVDSLAFKNGGLTVLKAGVTAGQQEAVRQSFLSGQSVELALIEGGLKGQKGASGRPEALTFFYSESSLLAVLMLASAGLIARLQPFNQTPPRLLSGSAGLATSTVEGLSQLLKLHTNLRRRLITRKGEAPPALGRAVFATLPLAATCGLSLTATEPALGSALATLKMRPLPDLQRLVSGLESLSGRAGHGAKKADLSAWQKRLNKLYRLADPKLSAPEQHSPKLLHVSPANEFEALPRLLYSGAVTGFEQLRSDLEKLAYDQKSALYELPAVPDIAISQLASWNFYTFELSVSVMDFLELLPSLENCRLIVQAPGPQLGYDVPREIEAAGAADDYLACFDESLKLFSRLQSENLDNPAVPSYACLLGHRQRVMLEISGRQLLAITAGRPADHTAVKLAADMIGQIQHRHPLLGGLLARGGRAASDDG